MAEWKRVIALLLMILFLNFSSVSRKDQRNSEQKWDNTVFASPDEPHSSCGWNTSETPTWTPNTDEENSLFWNVMNCHKALSNNKKKTEVWDEQYRPTPSSLRCGDNSNIMEEMQSIISQHDKIILLGDSVQRQVFFTLSCMMNSSLKLKNVLPPGMARRYVKAFEWKHEPTNTSIIYRLADVASHENGMFKTMTGKESHSRNALIINLGAHYHPDKIEQLKEDTRAVAETAQQTDTSMFWLETVDFQWPTANGDFATACVENGFPCKCEALTPDRILGTGEYKGPDHTRNSTDYPLYNLSIPPNHSLPCIPHCLPANWRNHITNDILADPKYTSAINLIPIWHQLVASGYAQSRWIFRDCTHKSTDALIAMVQQVLRALKRHSSAL